MTCKATVLQKEKDGRILFIPVPGAWDAGFTAEPMRNGFRNMRAFRGSLEALGNLVVTLCCPSRLMTSGPLVTTHFAEAAAGSGGLQEGLWGDGALWPGERPPPKLPQVNVSPDPPPAREALLSALPARIVRA